MEPDHDIIEDGEGGNKIELLKNNTYTELTIDRESFLGEFANVASNWLRYTFKKDAEAGKMFVGPDCSLCTNPNWVTDAKGLE